MMRLYKKSLSICFKTERITYLKEEKLYNLTCWFNLKDQTTKYINFGKNKYQLKQIEK